MFVGVAVALKLLNSIAILGSGARSNIVQKK